MFLKSLARWLITTSGVTFLVLGTATAVAQDDTVAEEQLEAVDVDEVVIVVGSRRVIPRSLDDSPVPTDVVGGDQLREHGSNDILNLMRSELPSYNVNRESIADAATLVRPASLRGLPPDNTLFLVNGKRRHRSAVVVDISESTVYLGSQGPDVGTVPPILLDRLEVLRDGASAQYGSDAIAGVVNFELREERSGFEIDTKWGRTFEGDGAELTLSGLLGMPLGETGFITFASEARTAEPTDRSLQRQDAQALIDTGNTAVRTPHTQVWGKPEVADDYNLFTNFGLPTDAGEIYGYAGRAQRSVIGGFYYRNPNDRLHVFTDGGPLRAVIDLNLGNQSGMVSNCPVLVSPGGTPTDQAAVDADRAALAALPANCWTANEIFPGGYTPSFSGDVLDSSFLIGYKGEFSDSHTYDFSFFRGNSTVDFFISNTWNPSLGPESPFHFFLGTYLQTESNLSADMTYDWEVGSMIEPAHVAYGFEYRVETFEIQPGDRASWVIGPYARNFNNFYNDGVTPMVPLSIGSHGFAGFAPDQSGEWDRPNIAAYTDIEANLTERFLGAIAFRYEQFDDFGSTFNYKLAGNVKLTDAATGRFSYSTGFRAPTPAQINVTKTSTGTVSGELVQRAQIPPGNQIAGYLGGEPLEPELARNINLGLLLEVPNGNITFDVYHINLKDRISSTGGINVSDRDPISECPITFALAPDNPQRHLATCLEELGVSGAADVETVSFYTNDFESNTFGVDLIYSADVGISDLGDLNITLAYNHNRTEVAYAGEEITRQRLVELENFLPQNRFNASFRFERDLMSLLLRLNLYGEWVQTFANADPYHPDGPTTEYRLVCQARRDSCYDGGATLDVEFRRDIGESSQLTVGVTNITNNFGPDEGYNTAPEGLSNFLGRRYAATTPWGFDGGFVYVRWAYRM